jgi:hypothetical protein
MASTYTPAGIELIADGEQSGTWGQTTNTNWELVEELATGVVSISLTGLTTYTLTTTDGVSTEGRHAIVKFTGSPGGTSTVTVSPNDMQKIYWIVNASDQSVIMTQGSGGNVTVLADSKKVMYCDGAGAGAAVVDLSQDLDIAFNDGDKLTFGDSADLEIYHDGSNSIINDAGTGNLQLKVGGTTKAELTSTGISVDTISELTSAAGVTIDSVLLKDDVVNATDVETGSISANDGTASATIANSTGVMTIASSVLTTTDINGGTIDGATIGGSSAAAITGTTITGTSFVSSGDMTFGDNDKAIFGAGSDLQIYHDGSNSYVKDNGTGDLYLQGESNVRITNASGQQMFLGQNGAGANLYYAGANKLYTTSTGIDVTGTVTADGLTVDGDITINDNSPTLTFFDANGVDQNFNFAVNGGTANIQSSTDAGVNTTRFRVETNGDISFYEDTGTTPKLFWDASAESLGIGTSSPSGTLQLRETTPSLYITSDDSGTGYLYFGGASTPARAAIYHNDTDDSLAFRTAGAERMRIDSSGNVGIGTSSPSGALHVYGGPSGEQYISSSNSAMRFVSTGGANYIQSGTATSSSSAADLIFTNVGGSGETMRIDSSGRVGIGTTSPSSRLHVLTPSASGTEIAARFGSLTDATGMKVERAGGYWRLASQSNLYLGADYDANSVGGDSNVIFETEATERMRINSSGNLLVGKTASGQVLTNGVELKPGNASYISACGDQAANPPLYLANKAASGTRNLAYFYGTSSLVGSITHNGSSTSYNTSSDYRLKEDWQPMSGSIDRLKNLNPVNFAWKVDGSRVDGFLAHEAAEVVPEAVTGEKDAVDKDGNPEYQGIDQAKLVPLLTAALQEAIAKIESLETRIATLEGA